MNGMQGSNHPLPIPDPFAMGDPLQDAALHVVVARSPKCDWCGAANQTGLRFCCEPCRIKAQAFEAAFDQEQEAKEEPRVTFCDSCPICKEETCKQDFFEDTP